MESKSANSEINWEILEMLPLKLQINLEAFLEFNDIRAVDTSETAVGVWPLRSAWDGEQELENCG